MLKQPISLIRGLFLVLAFSFLPVVAHGESLDSFDAVIPHQSIKSRKISFTTIYSTNQMKPSD